MNTEPTNEASLARRITKAIVRVGGLLFLVLFLLTFFGGMLTGLIEVVGTLLFGWWQFLIRTVPLIKWNWSMIGLAALCVGTLVFGGHWFMNLIAQSIRLVKSAEIVGQSWPWRWTWGGLALVIIGFAVGLAIGGMVHQVGWMLSSSEPLFENRYRGISSFNEMRQLDVAFQMALEDSHGDSQGAVRRMQAAGDQYLRDGSGHFLENYHFLVVIKANNTAEMEIIFPRDGKLRERIGGVVSTGQSFDKVTAQKLHETIATHREHLLAL